MKKFDFVHKIEEIKISIKGNGASNMNFFCTEKHTEYFNFLKTVS